MKARNWKPGWWGGVVTAVLAALIAAVPAAGQPTIGDPVRILAADPGRDDLMGMSVSLWGPTLVAGATGDDHGIAFDAGAAYVFALVDGQWTPEAKLTAGDAASGDGFGQSVAANGSTIIVGAPSDDDAGVNSGSAYVFVRGSGGWSQQAKLIGADTAASDQFGWSVALDGDTALIGSVSHQDGSGKQTGAAYVFVRSGGNWTQQAKLTAPDADHWDQFGVAVALEGNTAIIGAVGDDDRGQNSGSAYVFGRSGNSWSYQSKLTASDGVANATFGRPALSGDTAIIASNGAAYVFRRAGGSWSQEARLIGDDTMPFDGFGQSVAIRGTTAMVSAFMDDSTGSVYVFARDGSGWAQVGKVLPSDAGFFDALGFSSALHEGWAAAGAPASDHAGLNAGSLVLFPVVQPVSDPDSDGDGLPDSIDPDTLAEIVAGLPQAVFAAPGHRTALLARLQDVNRAIASGDYGPAIRHVENLLRRLDGCPDAASAGERADKDDWIVNCEAQRHVRNSLHGLIAALHGLLAQ